MRNGVERRPESGAVYQDRVNRDVLVVSMIETAVAMDHPGEILDVPGIDGVDAGLSDLRLSPGRRPVFDGDEPRILETCGRIVATCGQRDLFTVIHAISPDDVARMVDMGFRFTATASAASVVAPGSKQTLAAFRGSLVSSGAGCHG